ncbi:hypothetical protein [Streptomyces sp. NPDC088358]|uniref:hypothetical protein n=1 Tax=Streptomyces sp. NPDC088358 TaxID=3365857 RepID=UPI00381388D6
MRIPWRRRPAGRSRRLLDAAGIGPESADDGNDLVVGREVAYRVAQRNSGASTEVLTIVEELLGDEPNYEFVVSLLENIQNLVSHGLDTFWTPDEVYAQLGPRGAACWDTLAGFWIAVADWCARTGLPLEPVEPLLTIQNEQLKVLLWTGNRTLSTGEKLGLAQAVRYETANGASIPSYSHIAVALRSTGQQ